MGCLLKAVGIIFVILYVIFPIDLLPGPIDDILLVVCSIFYLAKNAPRDEDGNLHIDLRNDDDK